MVQKQWLSNNSMEKVGKITGYHTVQKIGKNPKVIKVGKVSEKYDILTVEEKLIALIVNNTKRILEMNPRKR